MLRPHRLADWRKREQCPACALQEQDRKRNLEVFVDALSEGELRAAFEANQALCVPHFLETWQTAKDGSAREYLVSVQRAKLTALLAELKELCRKFDYRFAGEGRGKESGSWARAVKLLAGEPGIF